MRFTLALLSCTSSIQAPHLAAVASSEDASASSGSADAGDARAVDASPAPMEDASADARSYGACIPASGDDGRPCGCPGLPCCPTPCAPEEVFCYGCVRDNEGVGCYLKVGEPEILDGAVNFNPGSWACFACGFDGEPCCPLPQQVIGAERCIGDELCADNYENCALSVDCTTCRAR